MSNSVNLSLDVTKTGIQNPLIKVRQGDGGFETLRTTVTANGEPMDLQGWAITFMGTTAGNHKIVDGNVTLVEAPNGIFDYTPSKAWGMDIGEFKIAYFKFVKGDGSASSANFRVNVIEAVDLTQEEAQNYISVVDTTIAEAREHLENSLADVTASVAATSSAASSLAVNVSSVASSAVYNINSTASNASSVASSAVSEATSAASNVSSAAENVFDKLNNLSIGGRNYILNSKFSTSVDVSALQQSVDPSFYSDKQVTTSVYVKYNNVKTMVTDAGQFKRVVFAVSFRDASGNMRYLDAQKTITAIGESFSGRVSQTIDLSGFNVASMPTIAVFIANFTADYVEASNPKLEIGNVPTDWTPAPEDVPSNDAQLVHKTGTETIAGDKTFTGKLNASTLKIAGDDYTNTASATANYFGATISFVRIGRQVTFTSIANAFNTSVAVGLTNNVLPNGFKPALQQNVDATNQDGANKFFSFDQSGSVYSYSAYSSGTQPRISGTYITADAWPV